MRDWAEGVRDVLPSSDELVRACLAVIPVASSDAAAVADWRALDRAAMLRLRQAGNMTAAATQHVDLLVDPDVIERLAAWQRIRSRPP